MFQALHHYTGTPIANGARTRDEQSLIGEHKREDLIQRRRKFTDDMAHAAVLADRAEFCDTFFPQPTDSADLKCKPKLKRNPFAKLATTEKLLEADVRARFTKAINANNLVPGFKLCECGERPDPSTLDGDKQKVDAAFYHTTDAPTDGKQHWPDQVIPVEFKRDDNSLDPWDDGKENINTEADLRKKGRGQCISYSELLYAIQHRIALFMLVIVGTRARFVRWDRSGTVVTRAFDYVEDWKFFCDILWRISLCTDTQLGLDPTATRLRVGDVDYDRMTAAAKPHAADVDEKERDLKPGELPADGRFVFKYIRKMFSESVNSPWPRYRVEVPEVIEDEDGNEVAGTRHFLIAKPTFRARGMSGRGTRGYVALDCKTGDFVWLKDAWRAHYLLVDKEGDVLQKLNKAHVTNVPTLICHGDIQNQVTLTPDWWEAKNPPSSSSAQFAPPSTSPAPSSPTPQTYTTSSSSASRKRKYDDESRSDDIHRIAGFSQFRADCPLRLHKHYRLVEKEVAMPLTNFIDGQQLTAIVLDCIYAHFHAYTKPKNPVLHRDISGGNILILPKIIDDENGSEIKWSGLLTDWEMSKPKDWKGQGRQPERTGTWQFLSVALLSGRKEVELCDELEAFFYVLLYYGVRYLRSNIDDSAVGTWISTFFDTYGVHNDDYICGNEKLSAIKYGSITIAATNSNSLEFNSPLDHILETLLQWFKANYIVARYEGERKRMNLLPAPQILLAQLADIQSSYSDSDAPRQRRFDERFAELLDSDSEDEDKDKGKSGDAPCQIFSRKVIQPSKDDYKSREQLLEHKPMMKLLTRSIASKRKGLVRWRKDDKVGDRVAEDYRPPIQPAGPTCPASLASNKRRKVDGPQFPMSMPNLTATQWPPKTPERKKPMVPPFLTHFMKQKQH